MLIETIKRMFGSGKAGTAPSTRGRLAPAAPTAVAAVGRAGTDDPWSQATAALGLVVGLIGIIALLAQPSGNVDRSSDPPAAAAASTSQPAQPLSATAEEPAAK